jgi:hypothetical protein
VRTRSHALVVAVWVLVIGLSPGGVREARAQSGVRPGTWSGRALARACWLGGGASRCASQVALLWESFARTALVAIQPAPAVAQIVRDGTFVHPDAPAFYMLKGLVPESLGRNACGQLRPSREELTRLVCAANRQLGASGQDRWPEERRELLAMHHRLVDSDCLPSSPPDLCTLVSAAVAVPPSASDEPNRLAD